MSSRVASLHRSNSLVAMMSLTATGGIQTVPGCVGGNTTLVTFDFYCNNCMGTYRMEMLKNAFRSGWVCSDCNGKIPDVACTNFSTHVVVQRSRHAQPVQTILQGVIFALSDLGGKTSAEHQAETALAVATPQSLSEGWDQVGPGGPDHQSAEFLREATVCMQCGMGNESCDCCHS